MKTDEEKYPLMIELRAFTCGYSANAEFPVNFQALAFEFKALLDERDSIKHELTHEINMLLAKKHPDQELDLELLIAKIKNLQEKVNDKL